MIYTCKWCGNTFECTHKRKVCEECRKLHDPWRPRIGSIQTAICKDCGKTFEYTQTRGRHKERCNSCSPTKVGTLISVTCDTCGKTFTYASGFHEFTKCDTCRADHLRKYLAEFARNKKDGIEKGTILTVRCAQCNCEFSYELAGRRRTLCNDCIADFSLAAMERLGRKDTWNYSKWKHTLKAFGGVCAYCSCKVSRFHRDHFIPKSRGGISDIGNIVPSCPSCNLRKHSKDPKAFLSPDIYNYVSSILGQLRQS